METAGPFRIQRRLAAGRAGKPGSGPSFIAVSGGKGRRPKWVLRWLGQGQAPLRGALREDMGDLASVTHPALALPASFGRDPGTGRAWVLRRYVEGSEIASALRGTAPEDLFPWLYSAAEALAILHRLGIAHRNLKLSNLIVPRASLFGRPGGSPRVVLCDPAWWPRDREAAFLDEASAAPEVLAGRKASLASDLYSLGAIFHRLITGRSPAIISSEVFEAAEDVPIDLERILRTMLHPDPFKRYADAPSLLQDLKRLGWKKASSTLTALECFVGRRAELSRVLALLPEEASPAAIAVIGEAGMGKSAFLRRLALEAELLGRRAIIARSHALGMPHAEALSSLLRDVLPAGPPGRSLLSRHRKLVAETRVLPALEQDPAARRVFLKGLRHLFLEAARTHPVLLVLDELHSAGPLAVEFLAGLVRDISGGLGDENRGGGLSLAVSFRTESPFRPALKPLLDAFAADGDRRLMIEIQPLAADAVDTWLDAALPDDAEARERIRAAPVLRGRPFAIHEAIRLGGLGPGPGPLLEKDLEAIHPAYLGSLPKVERVLLEVLGVLARPASVDLLAALGRTPAARVHSALRSLEEQGTLSSEEDSYYFKHGSFQAWLVASLGDERRRSLHGTIASTLEKRRGGPLREIAHHWLESETPRRGIDAALEAARGLARGHEDRSALRFYQAVLELLPPGGSPGRRAIAEEAAAACARTGEHRRGAEILESVIEPSSGGLEAVRLHALKGVLHHRAGEIAQAETHLEKALSLLSRRTKKEGIRERLRIESELAEIASTKGEYERAGEICRRALGDLRAAPRASRDREVRRAEMVLLGTEAHLMLRRFRYAEARALFVKSLGIGEAVGAVPEKSLILNNLGTLHVQENRFREAIDCYRQARAISVAFADDQSLAVLESNLAVLYARTGEADAALEALRAAARHEARCDSLRIRFLRLHSSGMVDLALGRYEAAIESLEAALSLSEELKDAHMAAFDLVHLSECRLYRGEMRAAARALDRALAQAARSPLPVASMVDARRAALAALRGDVRGFKAARASLHGRPPHGIEYLNAWNRLYLGWASRLMGHGKEAEAEIERARVFFSLAGAAAGEAHAAIELAAAEADSGRTEDAEKRLQALQDRQGSGGGPLQNPMLSARLLLYRTKMRLDRSPPAVDEAAALLVEAESWLIGRRIRDLESLARDLRRRIRHAGGGRGLHPHPPLAIEDPAGAAGDAVEMPGHRRPGPSRALSFVGQSQAIRSVSTLIRRIAPSALPVLITGETGTGKEVVGRAIHGESPRRTGPFVSINCAALPEELLEAELFGYSRGAFTGAESDHAGLLVSARGGSFLFDEIGELSLPIQGKLLRVLDRGRVRPIGGADEVEIDVRLIFSTNRDLESLVEGGSFRRDLYFRLGALEITVPPLRDRVEDIPLLVEHFRAQALGDGSSAAFDEGALRALAAHSWPGNVRELRNVVFRLVLTRPESISAADVRGQLGKLRPDGLFPPAVLRSRPVGDLLSQLEREHLVLLHADRGGDLPAIAQALGITVRALYDRFRRLGIRPGDLE